MSPYRQAPPDSKESPPAPFYDYAAELRARKPRITRATARLMISIVGLLLLVAFFCLRSDDPSHLWILTLASSSATGAFIVVCSAWSKQRENETFDVDVFLADHAHRTTLAAHKRRRRGAVRRIA